jgi:hypothetical protein
LTLSALVLKILRKKAIRREEQAGINRKLYNDNIRHQ